MSETGSKLDIQEYVPLAPFTTLAIGGPARFFARARNEDQVRAGLRFAERSGCPVFILGGGSNLVVSDLGFSGLVLKIELAGIDGLQNKNGELISAAAGEEWDSFVRQCTDHNLAGIECMSGIPGTVGATPVQNVGAYGQESGEVIHSVRVLDRTTLSLEDLTNSQCCFKYRTSLFNSAAKERYIIVRVCYLLRPGGKPSLQYQDLQRYFAGSAVAPSIQDARKAVLEIRRSKGMTLDDGDADCRSAGSFFKNPIVNPETADEAERKAQSAGTIASNATIPRFRTASGEDKLPAAWLIENAGFHKGYSVGRAAISTKHSLALVNRGGARAQEILELMQQIQDRVWTMFGIGLHPEPIFVGFNRE